MASYFQQPPYLEDSDDAVMKSMAILVHGSVEVGSNCNSKYFLWEGAFKR